MGLFSFFALLVLLVLNKCITIGKFNIYKPCIKDSIVIITGANTGLGFECAQEYAKLGALKVILACRDSNLGNEAVKKILLQNKNANVEFMHLDLSDFNSIYAFTNAFK